MNGAESMLETLVNNLVVSLKNARATQALKEAYDEVNTLNRAKDKMIHHMSHELQTPLALLKSALKCLFFIVRGNRPRHTAARQCSEQKHQSM